MSLDGSVDNNIPTDPMVPHDSLKEPLEWDGNLARIPGLLHETWVWMQRNGILQMLIKKRSRVLTNGKSITDDISVARWCWEWSTSPSTRSSTHAHRTESA